MYKILIFFTLSKISALETISRFVKGLIFIDIFLDELISTEDEVSKLLVVVLPVVLCVTLVIVVVALIGLVWWRKHNFNKDKPVELLTFQAREKETMISN